MSEDNDNIKVCEKPDYPEIQRQCSALLEELQYTLEQTAPKKMDLDSSAKSNRRYLSALKFMSPFRRVCKAERYMLLHYKNLVEKNKKVHGKKKKLKELCQLLIVADDLAQQAKIMLPEALRLSQKRQVELRQILRGILISHWELVDAVEKANQAAKDELEGSINDIKDALRAVHYFLDIFVCYAHDDEVIVKQCLESIQDILERKHVGYWWDRNELVIGDDYNEKIRRQLSQIDVGLVFISDNFFESKYIKNEELSNMLLKRERNGLTICPVLISSPDWDNWEKNHKWLHKTHSLPCDKGLKDMKLDERNQFFREKLAPSLLKLIRNITKFKTG